MRGTGTAREAKGWGRTWMQGFGITARAGLAPAAGHTHAHMFSCTHASHVSSLQPPRARHAQDSRDNEAQRVQQAATAHAKVSQPG